MPEILFITKGVSASSTRYRVTDYLPYWEKMGWATQMVRHDGSLGCWLDILRSARHADVVVILRRTFRVLPLKLLRMLSKSLVFDFDDAIFLRSSGEFSRSKLARFGRTLSACDLVWAGNRYLAENAAPFNDRVLIIPTALEVTKYAIAPAKPDDTLDLVWIGSLATRKHLLTVLPALERAAERLPSLRLKIVADFSLDSRVLAIQSIRWSAQGEALALASAHIGIAPLPDNPFTRGKCGLKILQYMAAGLPVIASPVGVNAELVEDEVTGYTAANEEGWVTAIERLAADRELRERLGREGRQKCAEQYALPVVFQRLFSSLTELTA